ncbi:MAG: Hpt domain-containing protein, partial [Burkholderiaceae bacterium]|nr:Hpt domain-containing protein [Burkholderiaceae bacterium]
MESRDLDPLQDSTTDIAPLAWVIDEIRSSLAQAVDGLKAYLANKQDAQRLRDAVTHVHQCGGALQVLDLRGVALVTDAIEHALRRWESDPKECVPSAVHTVETAAAAVVAYLDGLLAGQPNQPLRLFPYYRDVQQLTQAERAHPADLLFPDLTRRPPLHRLESRPLTTDQLRVRRVRYEEGLLGFLRDPENARARAQMRDALADLEQLPLRGLTRSFWWVVRGLLEAVAARQVPVDTDLKRVLARLNLQLRRLIEGGAAVAERLMIDALYYVGRADDGLPRVAEIKRLYGLPALIPPDFERPSLTTIDAEAMRALKEALTQAKALWAAVASGADGSKFGVEIRAACAAARRLQADAIARVLETIDGVTRDFGRLASSVRETLALEVAAALLFVELGAEQLPRQDEEYAARAQSVIDRLQGAFAGAALPDSAPWLSELARKAQDRLTMATVVKETLATLREIETRLDRFFRQPAERGELAATLPLFDQVCGVLAVLGADDAVDALRSVQASVRAFAEAEAPAKSEEFARIAGNLGAIGFFVESLARDAGRPRGTFRYDPISGVFSADLTRPEQQAPTDEEEAVPPPIEAPSPENIETTLAQHLALAHSLAERLVQDPGDGTALENLSRLLPQMANEAELIDDATQKERIARASLQLTQFAAAREPQAARALAALLRPPAAPPVPAPSAPLPESEAAADRELLDIFIEEANEVLTALGPHLASLRAAPDDRATLTTVRRAFHTLKGSSRMVGLKDFGEGAWAIEQCFNLWLAQERPATEDLLQLAATAHRLMREWIAAIAAHPRTAIDVGELVAAAQRVREGAPFEYISPEPQPPKALGSVDAPETTAALPTPEPGSLGIDADTPTILSETPTAVRPAAQAAPAAEELKRIGPLEISRGLYSVFLNEADETIRTLAQDIAEWRFEPQRRVSALAVRHAHSLAGIAATVGLAPLSALADPLDDLLQELDRQPHPPVLSPAQFDVLERAVERMGAMLHQFAAGLYPDEAPLEAAAVLELGRVVRAAAAAAGAPTPPLAPDPAGLPPAPEMSAAPAVTDDIEVDAAVLQTELPVAEEVDTEAWLAAQAAAQHADAASTPAEEERRAFATDDIDPDLLPVFIAEANDLLPAIAAGLRALAANPNDRAVARELMRQLHTAKGSARMAGAMRIGELVHDMETRIEAAMSLASVPPVVIEDLLSQYDQVHALFDRLQHPHSASPAPAAEAAASAPLAPVIELAAKRSEPPAQAAPETPQAAAPASTPVIRVRADLLDRLVDQAGEVAIARAKLENEVHTLKAALADLTENVARLRTQLRELEIQADAQIQARADQLAKDASTFDPLEFDRYTRLQELTRLLAESVEDVAMVHGNMMKGLQLADQDLNAQARLTRELQQQLMRVRLVPFANVAERLYRCLLYTS